MKIIIYCAMLVYSTQIFAGCSSDFKNGFNEYSFGKKNFDQGVASYDLALELSRSENPVLLDICNHLVDAVGGLRVATESYGNCVNYFDSALSSCSGNDRVQALQNKGVCIGNRDVSSDNQNFLRATLKETCFATAKSVRHLPLIDLGTVNQL